MPNVRTCGASGVFDRLDSRSAARYEAAPRAVGDAGGDGNEGGHLPSLEKPE